MERADISAKDLDLSRIPRDRLVLSDPILQWIRQEPELLKENDVPNPSEDHDQEAPGATARFVKVLGESRFGNQVTGTEDLVRMPKGFVPKNTEENTQWACRNICIIFLFCMCSTFLQLKLTLWTSLTHIGMIFLFCICTAQLKLSLCSLISLKMFFSLASDYTTVQYLLRYCTLYLGCSILDTALRYPLILPPL